MYISVSDENVYVSSECVIYVVCDTSLHREMCDMRNGTHIHPSVQFTFNKVHFTGMQCLT